MKHLRHILSVGLLIALVASASAQSWLTNGLVAYYPFNGNANDASGTGNNGLIQGNATFTPDGLYIVGNTFGDYGGGGFVKLPAFNPIGNHVTLNIWAKGEQINTAESYISLSTDSAGDNNCQLAIFGPSLSFSGSWIGFYGDVSTNVYKNWHMISYVMTPTNLTGYCNGICIGSTDGNFPAPNVSSVYNAIGSHWWWNGSGHSARLTCNLSKARIYSRALSSNEVAQLYAIESTPALALTNSQNLFIGPSNKFSVN